MIERDECRPESPAYHWAQLLLRRTMRLLLQHDAPLFRQQFRLFSAQSTLPVLQQYDRYLQLSVLSSELLDDIFPRIRRQLSLKTTRLRMQEEAPTRGNIDWARSIEQSGTHTLGLPPQRFDTHLRSLNKNNRWRYCS